MLSVNENAWHTEDDDDVVGVVVVVVAVRGRGFIIRKQRSESSMKDNSTKGGGYPTWKGQLGKKE